MCGQYSRSRCGCQSRQSGCAARSTCCEDCCGCGCEDCCGCESAAPSATISMADYEPFILVPTSVFDQGDVDCQMVRSCGRSW